MMLLILSLLLALTTAVHAQPEIDGKAIYDEALTLLHEGKPGAYSLLESIPAEQDAFIPAIRELQKLHYKSQDWGKFFGYATFYRQKFLREPKTKTFCAKLIELEALALLRHCRWQEARALVHEGIQLASALSPKDLPELQHLEAFLLPSEVFHRKEKDASGSSIPTTVFRDTQFWPIKNSSAIQVPHPKVLLFKIESRCQS